MQKERDINLDLLRFLGVMVIMLAHAGVPAWLFQLRNFGTPLLIVASALTYSVIYANRDLNVARFYQKRVSRLIIPAWLFLSFFFVLFYAVSKISGSPYQFSWEQIYKSYLFYSGIGYVWILKVYLILALLTPLVIFCDRRCGSNLLYFSALLIVYGAYELFLMAGYGAIPEFAKEFFDTVILIIIPYAVLYFLGFRMSRFSNRGLIVLAGVAFAVFVLLGVYYYVELGKIAHTQKYKYPPKAYYLSYALCATTLLYLLVRQIRISNRLVVIVVTWLSTNSLWIYLWHILAVYIWLQLGPVVHGDLVLSMIKFVYLLMFGVFFCWCQLTLVNKFITPSNLPFKAFLLKYLR